MKKPAPPPTFGKKPAGNPFVKKGAPAKGAPKANPFPAKGKGNPFAKKAK